MAESPKNGNPLSLFRVFAGDQITYLNIPDAGAAGQDSLKKPDRLMRKFREILTKRELFRHQNVGEAGDVPVNQLNVLRNAEAAALKFGVNRQIRHFKRTDDGRAMFAFQRIQPCGSGDAAVDLYAR